jgi:cytochrome c553
MAGTIMSEPNDATSQEGIIACTCTIVSRARARFSLTRSVIVGGVLGVLLSLGHSSGAVAQPSAITPGSGDDLRAVFAKADDVAEGKRLADVSCSGCHGASGISSAPGVPHLAGQRPAYLHFELRAYQSGARGDSAMNNAVKFLNDDALVKVSAYYASLDPVATDGARAAPTKPDPIQAGKAAAAGCAGCHGEAGISKTPGTPNLVGLDPKYLVAAMKGYKNGQRRHDMMKTLLSSVSDSDLNNIAIYYALQKPAPAQTPAAGNQTAGKAAATTCAGCHGEQGVSANPATPSLAGQDSQYNVASILAYKNGSRSDETMKGLVAALDDNTIKDLAAYYANQQPQPPNVRKPLTTADWVQRCDRCHGVNGNSTDPRLAALAGQRVDYLEKVLHAYKSGARKSPQMAAMSDVLSDDDIANLAAYYARQKARTFVYMLVPSK